MMPENDRLLACFQVDKAFLMFVQDVIKEFGLREAIGAEDQTYALGLKEVWQVSRGFCLFVHYLIMYTLLES